MAKTGKVIVECATGTFTRKTNRPYTHAVVALGRSEAWLEMQHGRTVARLQKDKAVYVAWKDDPRYTEDARRRYAAYAQEVDQQILDAAKSHELVLASNRRDKEENHGTLLSWHQSAALAQKAATKWAADGWCMVRVVPVTGRVLAE